MNVLKQAARCPRTGFRLQRLVGRKPLRIATAALALGFLSPGSAAFAQGNPFQAGDLVVSRVGTGTGALSSAATAVFLDEYTTSGTLVQSIALPTAASGTNNPFTNSGTATSEGALTLSADGQYLTLGGYNATPGTTGIASTSSIANPRVVAVISANGTIDTSTSLTDAYSGNNIRAAVTPDGTTIYTAGPGTAGTNGVRQTTIGSTTSTNTQTSPANVRVVNIFNGQVYVSTGSGTVGIYALGGSNTVPIVNTTSGTGTSSPYDFVFTDPNTVFVADDRANTSGGLLKFTNSGSGFALANTYNLAGATSGFAGLRGLTLSADGSTLYGVSTDNRIVSFSIASSNFATVATATTNTAFRGLDFAPVAVIPEGGTLASLSLGMIVLGGAGLRRRVRMRKV